MVDSMAVMVALRVISGFTTDISPTVTFFSLG
jgi:hypothetical protein